MPKPFKFRYVNEIVGTFVLLSGLLVVIAVVMIAFSKRWFTSVQTISLRIPSEVSSDLRPGTDVVIGGAVAGTVRFTTPDPNNAKYTDAILAIPSNFMTSVHPDSRVEIRRALGGVGDAYVKISLGSGEPIPPGASLTVSDVEVSPTEMAQQTMAELREVAIPMFKSINTLTEEMNRPEGNFQRAVLHANHIMTSIDEGQGTAGRLVNDEKLAQQVSEAAPKINAALADLRTILADTQKATAQLPQMAGSLSKQIDQLPALTADLRGSMAHMNMILDDIQKTTATLPQTTKAVNATLESLPGVLLQTQESLRQLQRLLEGAQKSWLLRPYISVEQAPGSRVSSDRVQP